MYEKAVHVDDSFAAWIIVNNYHQSLWEYHNNFALCAKIHDLSQQIHRNKTL